MSSFFKSVFKNSNSDENQKDDSGPSKLRNTGNNFSIYGNNINAKGDLIIGQTIKVIKKYNVTSQTSTDRIPTSPHYGVVNAVANFSGRVHELDVLHKNLQDTSMTVLSQVIAGAGGVGKTQLAAKYINQFQEHYDIIIFLIAENVSSLENDFCNIAKKYNIPTTGHNGTRLLIKTILDDLYNKMNQLGRSIIVFDNVESIEDITPFLCNDTKLMTNIKTLITARIRTWDLPDYPDIKVIQLDVWTLDEAQDFVKKYLLKTDLYIEEQAIKLCNCLGRYPLALRQAIGYIIDKNSKRITINKKFTIDDYLKAYDNQQKREELLSHSKKTDIYTLTVMNTWKLTAENLKRSSKGLLAIKILEYLAYLLPDKIPCREIFETETNEDNEEAISILYDNCLLWKDGDNISIHRLLQEVVRLDIQDREESVLRKLISTMSSLRFDFNLTLNLAFVWQKAAKYATNLFDLYSKSPTSPLLLILCDKNCDVDSVKSLTKIELDRKSYKNIQESLIRSITCINADITDYIASLFNNNLNLNINYKDCKGDSAVMIAISYGRADLVEIFINRSDCDFMLRNNNGQTSLLVACNYGRKEIFEYLMSKRKFDINDQDEDDDTALILAARSGNVNLVESIINKPDCNFMHRNRFGQTALLEACVYGNKEMFECLMRNRKYNINDEDKDGDTALILAAGLGNVDLVEIIINRPECNFMHRNRLGQTAPLAACNNGRKEAFEYLLNNQKYNINDEDEDGNTALILAAVLGNVHLVEIIINRPGCNFMHRNRLGQTALLAACNYGMKEVFEYLMNNRNFNINDKDEDGNTALILAVLPYSRKRLSGYEYRFKGVDLVKNIISRSDCNLLLQNKEGKTALMIAKKQNDQQIVDLLSNRS